MRMIFWALCLIKNVNEKNGLLLAYPSSIFFTQLLTRNKKCDFCPCFYPAFSPDFLGAMKEYELLKLPFSLLYFFLFYCFLGWICFCFPWFLFQFARFLFRI